MTKRRGRSRRPTPEVETIELPAEHVAFADARIAALVRRCVLDENIVESVARSCYLQGVVDGVQLVAQRPETLEQVALQPVTIVYASQDDPSKD
jgi:hypothetical protein